MQTEIVPTNPIHNSKNDSLPKVNNLYCKYLQSWRWNYILFSQIHNDIHSDSYSANPATVYNTYTACTSRKWHTLWQQSTKYTQLVPREIAAYPQKSMSIIYAACTSQNYSSHQQNCTEYMKLVPRKCKKKCTTYTQLVPRVITWWSSNNIQDISSSYLAKLHDNLATVYIIYAARTSRKWHTLRQECTRYTQLVPREISAYAQKAKYKIYAARTSRNYSTHQQIRTKYTQLVPREFKKKCTTYTQLVPREIRWWSSNIIQYIRSSYLVKLHDNPATVYKRYTAWQCT